MLIFSMKKDKANPLNNLLKYGALHITHVLVAQLEKVLQIINACYNKKYARKKRKAS